MKATEPMLREMSVLLGTSEPAIKHCLQLLLSNILREEFEVRYTIAETDVAIGEAMKIHRYEVVVLFINTMLFVSGDRIRFDWALDLIRQAKRNRETIVITITTFRPLGFTSMAEQAGADAMIDAPFTLADLDRAIRTPWEARKE